MISTDPLDRLLEQLCQGDEASAEQVYLAYEPYLRLVVRKMLPARLRPKFDSIDVVQSVWVDILAGFHESRWHFASTGHLRAFLVKVTRNRFLDRLRQQRAALEHEQSLEVLSQADTPLADEPDPGSIAQADELWERMLALCPPQHQQLLELKRQGATLADIAGRTGLHPSSIRRIFYELARRLAFQHDRETASKHDQEMKREEDRQTR
jgi:RNA polymerase sigma-70 factor (ECF subfamily)